MDKMFVPDSIRQHLC